IRISSGRGSHISWKAMRATRTHCEGDAALRAVSEEVMRVCWHSPCRRTARSWARGSQAAKTCCLLLSKAQMCKGYTASRMLDGGDAAERAQMRPGLYVKMICTPSSRHQNTCTTWATTRLP